MKFICVLLLSVFSLQTLAQDFPSPFQFKAVDTSVTGSQAELFSIAKAWVAITYNSANDVVQLSDRESGKIIGKAVMEVSARPGGFGNKFYVDYTFTIDVRDNKVRCILSDFNQQRSTYRKTPVAGGYLGNDTPQTSGIAGIAKSTWRNMKKDVMTQSYILLDDFERYMSQHKESVLDEDGF